MNAGASEDPGWVRLLSGEARGVFPSTGRAALGMVSIGYRAGVALRNVAYTRGWKRAHRAGRPVISVGNLTTGGTGKTPVVAWILEKLLELGVRPAVLTRGYRPRGAATSDEAELLRHALRGAARVVVNPDRVAGTAAALRDDPSIRAFVMDDGFQHRRLARDLDLLLIDMTNPFGYDHLLPRGLLREPKASIARADAVVLTRSDLVDEAALLAVESEVRRYTPTVPILRSWSQVTRIVLGGSTESPAVLQSRRVFLFAGIGNPLGFERTVERLGAVVAGRRWFNDHHVYTTDELTDLRADARRADALALTTAKDAVKIAPSDDIAVVQMRAAFAAGDEAVLSGLLRAVVA